MSIDFQPWPKIARLNRNITITEKLDGTNAAVVIEQFDGDERDWSFRPDDVANLIYGNFDGMTRIVTRVFAQSRTRFITPKQDNYGFAGWVQRNAEALVATLGEGTHFGEWWGAGIQRKYGLTGNDKRFSLFNTARWTTDEGLEAIVNSGIPGLNVVPVIHRGAFSQKAINDCVEWLDVKGSQAAPGFMRPEGIVVYHEAARHSFKVTLEGDAAPKGAAGHALDNERIAA